MLMKNSKPCIYPTPKEFHCSGDEFLRLKANSALEVHGLPEKAIFRKEIKEIFGSRGGIVLQITCGEGTLKTAGIDSQAYTLNVKSERIEISANTPVGVLYALQTLRQLKKSPGVFYLARIVDYPDVEFRAASRWLIELEGARGAYDWGRGRKDTLARYKRKLDFALRYKINMVFFEGFFWELDKYPYYAADIRNLTNYAAKRGITLEFGGHGIGIGGRIPGENSVMACGFVKGLGGLNRRSYPNGELYMCMGKSADHPTRFHGSCRSNEALNKLKQQEIINYVRKLEPGMLYIHHEDISDLNELQSDWLLRCNDCRKRWPNDDIFAADGAAGAMAYSMKLLYEAIVTVKNPAHDYDAQRDCQICFVPVGYGSGDKNDAVWQRQMKYYALLSSLLPHEQNLCFALREQYMNHDNKELRVAQMAELIHKNNQKLLLFAINGSDGYTSGGLFSPGALLNGFYRGADIIFNFAGTIFQEPQEVFNCEYTWNLPAVDWSMAYAMRQKKFHPDEDLMTQFPYRYSVPEDMKKPGGFLYRFCRQFYGPEAGKYMAEMHSLGESGQDTPVLYSLSYAFIKRHLFGKHFVLDENTRPALLEQYQKIGKMTGKALKLADKARKYPMEKSAAESVQQLYLTLQLGCMTARIAEKIFAQAPAEKILPDVKKMRKFFKNNFGQYPRCKSDGEVALYPEFIDRLENAVKTYCQ